MHAMLGWWQQGASRSRCYLTSRQIWRCGKGYLPD
jgi:hypothetical protein